MFTLFSDFKVGTKIKTGYALVLCIAAFLVYQAYMAIDRLVDRADNAKRRNSLFFSRGTHANAFRIVADFPSLSPEQCSH